MKLSMKKKADLMLLTTAIGWALSTILIKLYMADMPVFHVMFGRYFIAFVLMATIWKKKFKHINKSEWKSGGILAIFLFFAFTFAIMSLSYTSASKSGFFVAMSVLFVPIVSTFLKRKLPNKWVIFSVVISIIGLYLVAGINGDSFNTGDALALLCALAYTVYILLMDQYAKDIDASHLVLIQLGIVTAISFVAMVVLEGFNAKMLMDQIIPIIVIAIVGTALTSWSQTAAQKHASPESVGLILLGEPLLTLIMAAMILNETIIFKGLIGAVLLLSAMVITVLKEV